MKGNYFRNPSKDFLNPGNYFLNCRNFFLNSRNYFLNPGSYCLNPGSYCLNPGNYVLNWAPNQNLFSPPVCFYQSQQLDKDSSQSLEVQRLPHTSEPCSTKRERLPGCWCRRSSFSFVLCSLTLHLRIRHCYVFTFQSVFILYHNLCLSLSVYCPV